MNASSTPPPKRLASTRIEIEIDELTAACIWENHWGSKSKSATPLADIVKDLAEADAEKFRISFPRSIPAVLQRFREANPSATSDAATGSQTEHEEGRV